MIFSTIQNVTITVQESERKNVLIALLVANRIDRSPVYNAVRYITFDNGTALSYDQTDEFEACYREYAVYLSR